LLKTKQNENLNYTKDFEIVPGSREVIDPDEEEREPEEELPPSVKLGVGYTKPHYQVLI
jgi:hypothetical protein